MYDEFELSDYKITTDPQFMDNRNHMTDSLKLELEKIYPQVQKGTKTIIRKLIHLIEKHPQNPQLKNYLSVAYNSSGNYNKAVEVNKWILKEHPDYLFGLLNKAHQFIQDGKPEEVPKILGESMELKSLYPTRDEFHLAEVTGFLKLAIIYFATIEDSDQANVRMDILTEIAPEHPDTEVAQNKLMSIQFEVAGRRLAMQDKMRIEVEVQKYDKSIQTHEKQIFNHPEIEWLYQFDSEIAKEKLEKILSLPRETLIKDLTTILKDIIQRYKYYSELEDRGEIDEKSLFFGLHAIYILGELEAEETLAPILETFKFDSDFLHFWYSDLLTETFWSPLLKVGKNQFDLFKSFVLTPNLDTYSRAEIIATVIQIALHYPEQRDEVIEWVREILHVFIQSKPESGIIDSDQIGLMIGDIMEIQGVELIEEIEQLYELGYVSEGIAGSYKSVKDDIARKPGYECKNELLSIFEQYDELNSFSPNMSSGKNKHSPYIPVEPKPNSQPVVAQPKIGRNEPCRCGSGKKYKKCCLYK